MSARRDERGFVLITAISVLMIMLLLGVALMAVVNVQTDQTGHERNGEAAFSLAENALQAEASQLRAAWPSSADSPAPVCSEASTDPRCQAVAGLGSTFTGSDYASAHWSGQALDDARPSDGSAPYDPTPPNPDPHYHDALATASTPTRWDANGDQRIWVRGEATVGGQTRILVEQVVHPLQVVTLPQNSVTAGGFQAGNNGNTLVYGTDPSGVTGSIEVRCGDAGSQPAKNTQCLGWDQGAVDPSSAYGYLDPGSDYQTLSDDEIQGLIQTARQQGTYYAPDAPGHTGCPPAPTNGIVVVNFPSPINCTSNGATWNSAATPGALVILNGTMTFNNGTFYGVLYMANQQGQAPASGPCAPEQMNTVVTLKANAIVVGPIFVDRCGVVNDGDTGGNLQFSLNAFLGLQAYQPATLAQNTFEIVPNHP